MEGGNRNEFVNGTLSTKWLMLEGAKKGPRWEVRDWKGEAHCLHGLQLTAGHLCSNTSGSSMEDYSDSPRRTFNGLRTALGHLSAIPSIEFGNIYRLRFAKAIYIRQKGYCIIPLNLLPIEEPYPHHMNSLARSTSCS